MHSVTQGHMISTSLSDLNTWCYACSAYIISNPLCLIREALYLAKFNTVDPATNSTNTEEKDEQQYEEEKQKVDAEEKHEEKHEPAPAPANVSNNVTTNQCVDKGGYVDPKKDCPHIEEHVVKLPSKMTMGDVKALFSAPCADCGDTKGASAASTISTFHTVPSLAIDICLCYLPLVVTYKHTREPQFITMTHTITHTIVTENWICNHCLTVCCSRYIKEHMMMHCATENHLIATSMSDLNTWCYGCNAYIISPDLHYTREALYLAKFGVQ